MDFLHGGLGADTLIGGAGDDQLYIDGSDVSINGGDGTDIAMVWSPDSVLLDLAASDIEIAIGHDGDDTLLGSGSERLVLAGGAGNDSLAGANGDDLLEGGLGSDTIVGGAGVDIALFAGSMADYDITVVGSTVIVTDTDSLTAGDEGADTLSGVERLYFDPSSTVRFTK